jgi:Fe2+ transport system protein B
MSSEILLCSSGLALGLRHVLSSLAQAILTGIQNVSVALPFILVFGSLVSLLEFSSFSGLRQRLAG